jgi:polysaccharide pyruvyl transferase CsaB
MNWLIYGDILENHVVESFVDELQLRNQTVFRLSSLTRGHKLLPVDQEEVVFKRLKEFLDGNKIEILFNFRASELSPKILDYFNLLNIKTIVWFPDDPLLYESCYKYVAKYYHITLHCGDQNVLDYYENKLNVKGITFPFWSSPQYFPYVYNNQNASIELGFLGNCHGVARKDRYSLLASLPFNTKIYGKLPKEQTDYASIHGGYIDDYKYIPSFLSNFKMGLNLAQSFRNLENSPFYYKDVEMFKEFYIPSRIIQYSACGIPIINKSSIDYSFIPTIINVGTRVELIEKSKHFLQDDEKLNNLSANIYLDFEKFFSVKNRVELLLRIIHKKVAVSNLTSKERANLWKMISITNQKETNTVMNLQIDKNLRSNLTSVNDQRNQLRNKKIKTKERYRILHIGRSVFGENDIVNRMKQALENLGHLVFDLNTDDFKKIVHNPDRLVGGHGPIEIKLELIKPILTRFKPQFIICNAGGYTFSEKDSKWLKANGFILIGITLSDPDVFPGTKKFAHRFDYHATNAMEAIEMYKELGIKNTFHFPFAIDRSFVEAEAVEKRDWKADVICIGNAANRPDRNKFMKELEPYFNVKVYGTGWEIPNSFSVKGEDFFSAARAGDFHVNFPGTRAGYTNVKVGVFESIANGGILCTEYFEEMNQFFEYDKEIIGYKDANDLRSRIEYYLNNPNEAEIIRRRAFDRLVNEHLWEARWEQLFSKILSDIRAEKKLLPKERYSEIDLVPIINEPVKIIVQGYYGAKNSGDDFILEAISNKITVKYPESIIMVAGFNRENITLLQGFYSLPRTDVYKMEKYIKNADLVIYGGGGLLNDYTFNNSAGIADFFDSFTHGLTGMGIIPTMANIHNVPVMYFALGVGPLENLEARKFVRFMSEQIDIITVRDKHSKDLMESIEGIRKEVIQTADPTLTLPYPGKTYAQEYFENHQLNMGDWLISVSLRAWKDNPSEFNIKVAKYLDMLISKTNATVIFVPFQFASGNADDNKIHSQVMELMEYKESAHLYDHIGNYDEMLSILGAVDLGVNMRLHGSIMQNLYGVPTIGFNYDDKVKGHYETVEMEEYLLGLDFEISDAETKAIYIKNNKNTISNNLVWKVQEKIPYAELNFEYVYQLIEKGLKRDKSVYRNYPRSQSVREIKTKELMNEIKQHKKEALNLRKEIKKHKKEAYNLRLRINRITKNKSFPKNVVNEDIPIDLSKAKFSSETKLFSNIIIPISTDEQKDCIGIRLDKQTPTKNDFSIASVCFPVKNGNDYQISMVVHSPYEKPRNRGRIRYEIYIDGKRVYKEDIAKNGKPNNLTFNFSARENIAVLELKLIALKDCEKWSWGNHSKTFISDVYITQIENKKRTSLLERIFKRVSMF